MLSREHRELRFGCSWLFGGVILFLWGVAHVWDHTRLAISGESAEATIVAQKPHVESRRWGRKVQKLHVKMRFVDRDGKSRRIDELFDADWEPPGETVPIVYLPSDPEGVWKMADRSVFGSLTLVALGVALAYFGGRALMRYESS